MRKIILFLFLIFVCCITASADETTTYLGLTKPSIGSSGWGTKLNTNCDTLDALFTSGPVLLHEKGGLEADVSAYSGLVKISGGSTSQVTDNSSSWNKMVGGTFTDTKYCTYDAGNGRIDCNSEGGAGGETNTASSQGTGTSIYYQKSGVDLQFNAIKSESDDISVALDGVSHDVEFTFNPGSIGLDEFATGVPALAADSVDAITEIASGLKSGSDTTLVTGTAGTNGNLAKWNADGDLVDSDVQEAQVAELNVAETIAADWVNTANPWADNEVADDVTLTNITQITNRSITNLSATNWRLFYSGSGGVPIELALGADGTFLESNGASAAPAFRALVDGDIPAAITRDDEWDAWNEHPALTQYYILQGNVSNVPTATSTIIVDTINLTAGSKYQVAGAQIDFDDLLGSANCSPTGAWDFSGGDFEFPQASPAAPSVDGGAELDQTDGTLVIQNSNAHAELGSSTDVVYGKMIHAFRGTFAMPDSLQSEIDQWQLAAIESSEFPHGIVVTDIYLKTSASSTYAVNVENWDDPTTINASNPTIDAITTSTSTEVHEDTITYNTIGAGQIIMLDLPNTDISWFAIQVEYYEPIA